MDVLVLEDPMYRRLTQVNFSGALAGVSEVICHLATLLGSPLVLNTEHPHSGTTQKKLPHRVWGVVELVEDVLEDLPQCERARMAAVCHSMWSIAAPFVWRDLPQDRWNRHIESLIPDELVEWMDLFEESLEVGTRRFLLRLLAEAVATRSQVATPPPFPDLSPSAWERFSLHARWVRSLQLVLDGADAANTEVILRLLQSHLTAPLFPQLRQLFIRVYRFPAKWNIVDGIVTPSLQELEINFCQDVNGAQPEDIVSFGHSARCLMGLAQYPVLRRFRCRARSPMLGQLLGLSSELASIIARQPRLAELELVNFDDVFIGPFLAASALQYLSRISFFPPALALTADISVETNGVSNHPFPALKVLEVILPPHHVPTLLSLISSPNLQQLEILFQFRHPTLTDSLPGGVLREVAQFATLTTTSLHFPNHKVQWVDLQPLLSCSKLQVVGLAGRELSAVIGNPEIGLMARSWADLQQLQVRDNTRYSSGFGASAANDAVAAPLATLGGLGVFAVHCPHLRVLDISVDASRLLEEERYSQYRHSTQILRLPCSMVSSEVHEVASYISRMWPRLRFDQDHYDPYQGSESEVAGLMGERWEKIWELVLESHLRQYIL